MSLATGPRMGDGLKDICKINVNVMELQIRNIVMRARTGIITRNKGRK